MKYDEKRIFNVLFRSYKKNVKIWCTSAAVLYLFDCSWEDSKRIISRRFFIDISLKEKTDNKFMKISVNKTLPKVLGRLYVNKNPFNMSEESDPEWGEAEYKVREQCHILLVTFYLKILLGYLPFDNIDTVKIGLKEKEYFDNITQWSEPFIYSPKTSVHGEYSVDKTYFETQIGCKDQHLVFGYVREETEQFSTNKIFAQSSILTIYSYYSFC
eukprot:460523_1